MSKQFETFDDDRTGKQFPLEYRIPEYFIDPGVIGFLGPRIRFLNFRAATR
jgi:hypothetical protein